MYIMPEMIELGIEDGKEWPSAAHRTVAQRLFLCNPLIHTRDALTSAVSKLLTVPLKEIETLTLEDLGKYGLGIYVS